VQPHSARPLERFEAANRRQQFHSVVGCQRLAAEKFFFGFAPPQQGGPPARARISAARSVGKDFDERELGH
jgi:hypothetical protein